MVKQDRMHSPAKLVLKLAKEDPMDQNMGFPELHNYYISDENQKIIQSEFEKYFDRDYNELQETIMPDWKKWKERLEKTLN